MTPVLYRSTYSSPIGNLLLTATENALTEVRFSDEKATRCPLNVDLPVFRRAFTWLETYFKGDDPGTPPPLYLRGTPFRLLVWQILQEIPYHHTVTYKNIAEKVCIRTGKQQMSAQAVGNAVGHNPICIFIPCHRVVGTNGNLTGYAGGLNRKIFLLKTEHIDTSDFFLPG